MLWPKENLLVWDGKLLSSSCHPNVCPTHQKILKQEYVDMIKTGW